MSATAAETRAISQLLLFTPTQVYASVDRPAKSYMDHF